MSKRHVKTWENLNYASSVDDRINKYAEENNLTIVQVSLAVGFKYLHVSALFEEKS